MYLITIKQLKVSLNKGRYNTCIFNIVIIVTLIIIAKQLCIEKMKNDGPASPTAGGKKPKPGAPAPPGGKVVVPKGLEVPSTFSITLFDTGLGQEVTVNTNTVTAISNQDYEDKINDNKRNIDIIKPRFIGLVIEEMERLMKYPKGSSQYVSKKVVRGENIRIYE